MNWEILIPAAVGIVCAILGYLIGKSTSNNDKNTEAYTKKIAALEAALADCKASKLEPEVIETTTATTTASTVSSLAADTTVAALLPFDADAAKAVFGKKIKENDLTVVEGIGPKISELFHNNNITTWKALSECTLLDCRAVLKSGGDRFKMHNPGTWPQQAKMAYEGRWADLLKWQDLLDGGK